MATLWFDRPASSFHQALPLGNGRIGAMVFGGVDEERIVLNETQVGHVYSVEPSDSVVSSRNSESAMQ